MNHVTVLDFETTGLFVDRGDKIVEIGAIKLAGNDIIGIFETFVNPERALSETAAFITGITPEMLADAPTIEQVLPKLVDFIGDDIVAMHNASFDSSFLNYEMSRLGIERKYTYYCTLKTARVKIKSSPNYKLATLKNHLQLETSGVMHRALSDTYVTAQLYLKLEGLYGISSKDTLKKQMKKLFDMKSADAISVTLS